MGFALFSTGIMIASPFIEPLPLHQLAQGSQVFGLGPRLLAAFGSGIGATIVFVGSITSAIRRRTRRNITGNGLIALGTAILGMSGLLNSVADAMTGFAITLVLGICVIFIGFLTLTARQPVPAGQSPQNVVIKHDDSMSILSNHRKRSITKMQTM